MASWTSRSATNAHLLPYVDAATAPPETAAALATLPFERNVFKVCSFTRYMFRVLFKHSSYWQMRHRSFHLS